MAEFKNYVDDGLSEQLFNRVGIDLTDSERLDKVSLTYWADVRRRFKENKLAMLGLILLALVIATIFIGPLLSSKISGIDYQHIDTSIKNLKPNKTN